MQLSDNISCIIPHPKQPNSLNFPQPKDPDFLFSVITHFRKGLITGKKFKHFDGRIKSIIREMQKKNM